MIASPLRSLAALILLTSAALVTACGSSGGGTGGDGGTGGTGGTGGGGATLEGCMDLCPVLNKCPGIAMSDCAVDCPPVAALNDAGGCAAAYDAMVKCFLASMDPCTANTSDECINQAADYVTCQSAYCDANPGTAGCP